MAPLTITASDQGGRLNAKRTRQPTQRLETGLPPLHRLDLLYRLRRHTRPDGELDAREIAVLAQRT